MTCCIFGHSLYNTIYVYIIWMHVYAFFVFFCIFLHTVCTSMQCCIQLHFVAYSEGCIHMHTFVVCIYLHNIARQGALESCSHAMMHTVSFGVAPFWEAIKCVNMHRYSCIKIMQQYALNCIWLHYCAYDVCCIQMHDLHTNTYSLDSIAYKPCRLIAYLLHICCILMLYAKACPRLCMHTYRSRCIHLHFFALQGSLRPFSHAVTLHLAAAKPCVFMHRYASVFAHIQARK